MTNDQAPRTNSGERKLSVEPATECDKWNPLLLRGFTTVLAGARFLDISAVQSFAANL
jgi:hypothetical protein